MGYKSVMIMGPLVPKYPTYQLSRASYFLLSTSFLFLFFHFNNLEVGKRAVG